MNQDLKIDDILSRLPKFLIDELIQEYGMEITKKIISGYMEERVVSLRINNLKTTIESVKTELLQSRIEFETVPWSPLALVIKNAKEKDLEIMPFYQKGEIYLQSLSSMLPPIILNPKQGYDILDMASAPGGKTTQMAAITSNKSKITACEQNPIRAEKLKFNLKTQGVTCAYVLVNDARKLDDFFTFDQILLDAPCSGSGTIEINHPRSYEFFSQKLVDKSISTQYEMLVKALKLLKPSQEMVYSTCSIIKKENEEILLKALKTCRTEIVPIDFPGIEHITLLPSKIEGTLSVCPNRYYEGFFVAKIRKLK